MNEVRAYVTWYGAKGGRQSVRRPIEVLDLADGTHRFRLDINDLKMPKRATYAEFEVELRPSKMVELNLDSNKMAALIGGEGVRRIG